MIYEVTIQHVMIDKNGNDKKVKERYVVQDAESFSDAEQRVYDEFGELYTDLDIVAIKGSAYKGGCTKVLLRRQNIRTRPSRID